MPAHSIRQQRLMGMALAHKRGELPDASSEVKNLSESMSESDLHDFAATSHKGLPKKASDDFVFTDPVTKEATTVRLHPFDAAVLEEFHKLASAKRMTVDEMTKAFFAGCSLKGHE